MGERLHFWRFPASVSGLGSVRLWQVDCLLFARVFSPAQPDLGDGVGSLTDVGRFLLPAMGCVCERITNGDLYAMTCSLFQSVGLTFWSPFVCMPEFSQVGLLLELGNV